MKLAKTSVRDLYKTLLNEFPTEDRSKLKHYVQTCNSCNGRLMGFKGYTSLALNQAREKGDSLEGIKELSDRVYVLWNTRVSHVEDLIGGFIR